MSRAKPLVFLVAGEPSGDAIGGKLMRALKRERGGRGELAFAWSFAWLPPAWPPFFAKFDHVPPTLPYQKKKMGKKKSELFQKCPKASKHIHRHLNSSERM